MQIYINGESRVLPDDIRTVAELVETIDIEHTDGTAVAVNERVVPASQWEETRIEDGDDIEVIRATQGG